MGMVEKHVPDDVRIGEFDLPATYTYARARPDGLPEGECKERGLVAVLMGSKPSLGPAGGKYEDHEARMEAAERAGLLKGDILISFDGQTGKMSETGLLAYTMQKKSPGDEVAVTVLRNGKRERLKFALQ
jgi:hypothetical protein